MSKKLAIVGYPVIDAKTLNPSHEHRLVITETDSSGKERHIDLAVFYNYSTVKKLIETIPHLNLETLSIDTHLVNKTKG